MHKTWNCDRLQGFADEVLKMVKGANQEKIPEQTKGVFPEAHKGVNYIYGGPDSYEVKAEAKTHSPRGLVSHPVLGTKRMLIVCVPSN
jgi:hypothetical protein